MDSTHLRMTLDPPTRPGVYLFSRVMRSVLGDGGHVIDAGFTHRVDDRYIRPTATYLVDVQELNTILSARFLHGPKADAWEPVAWIQPITRDLSGRDPILALWSRDPITAGIDMQGLDNILVERGMRRKPPRKRIHPPELDHPRASRKRKKD